jgi:hypothetical protein
MALLFAGKASAGTIYVRHDASGLNDGSGWENAFSSLDLALQAALPLDNIWVARGEYHPQSGVDFDQDGMISGREATFRIPVRVSVYGGFAGDELEPGQRRDFGPGENNETVLAGNDIYHVVFFQNTASQTVLDGFTIRGGAADGESPQNQVGAGIFIDGSNSSTSNPEIRNCVITGNSALQQGAGIMVNAVNGEASPLLLNCIIEKNSTAGNGAGIAIYSDGGLSTIDIRNCFIRANSAAGYGGGFCSDGAGAIVADILMSNSVIAGNTAEYGGGISTHIPNTGVEHRNQFINCTITANSAVQDGGAIYALVDAPGAFNGPEIVNSIVWANDIDGDAGLPGASAAANDTSVLPLFNHSLIANSRSDTEWNAEIGSDLGGNIDMDPAFIDGYDPVGMNCDFHLSDNSPALFAGVLSDDIPAHDILGVLRPNPSGTNPDMGAYENSGADASFPVALSFFTAHGGNRYILLEWQSLTEVNNDAFLLHRSTDGVNYELLAELPGQGTVNQSTDYHVLDNNLVIGKKYWYRLSNRDINGKITQHQEVSGYPTTSGIEMVDGVETVNDFRLEEPYPNPFNPETTIDFAVPQVAGKPVMLTLSVYNMLGQQVRLLYRGSISGGDFRIRWDGQGDHGHSMPSGMYLVLMRTATFIKMRKIMLLR